DSSFGRWPGLQRLRHGLAGCLLFENASLLRRELLLQRFALCLLGSFVSGFFFRRELANEFFALRELLRSRRCEWLTSFARDRDRFLQALEVIRRSLSRPPQVLAHELIPLGQTDRFGPWLGPDRAGGVDRSVAAERRAESEFNLLRQIAGL